MSGFEAFIYILATRFSGPLRLRFIVQPLIAIGLGMHDGRLDAKAGSPPFLLDLFTHPKRRKELLRSAGPSIMAPVAVGIVLDAIVQYLIFKFIYPGQAVLVGFFIIAIPYSMARGLANRFVSRKRHAL